MKTARFSDLIKSCGKPEVYLQLMPLEKDAILKRAVKEHKVATVFQTLRGNKTDHAEVGFHEGTSRQYLTFKKSARAFEGRRIVGIKYELIEPDSPPKRKLEAKPKELKAKMRAPKPRPPSKEAAEKIVAFAKEEPPEAEEVDGELRDGVRQALKLLEDGKAVAAYNLLKRLI